MFSYLNVGNFLIIDLIAATTNALNGALLAQRPDYYRGKQWTIVGILIIGVFGGIGGGSARDIIAGKLPPGVMDEPLVPHPLRAGRHRRPAHRLRQGPELP